MCLVDELVYFVPKNRSSLSAEQASPAQLLEMLRSYWHIENNLHYPRDVTLHEDQTRFKKHSAAQNMTIMNNLVLSLIARSAFHFVPSARRFFAAFPEHALTLRKPCYAWDPYFNWNTELRSRG